jgi:glycosyltransferase involved in cell wall biosynthesis
VSEHSVTIIIAARPDQAEVRAVAAAQKLECADGQVEILLARGRQPSVQRNAALRAARGEIIYFLDDDSIAPPGNLRRALEHFQSPDVKMAGGPSLCPSDAPALQQAFALTMGSWLAFGPSRSRYRACGGVRATSEKELILCNLLARREDLLQLGGFNEALYPNEENALMDELQKRGGKLLYDPDLIVHRPPRPNFRSFCKMLLSYGRGRAEQFRLHPTLRSAPNFVPPLFCLYLVALPFLPAVFRWVAEMALAAANHGIDFCQPCCLWAGFLARVCDEAEAAAGRCLGCGKNREDSVGAGGAGARALPGDEEPSAGTPTVALPKRLSGGTPLPLWRARYSHSMVAGGLLEMSKQTRLTPLTSLMMRLESLSSRS